MYDTSVEKTLLVNPVCPVRIILEYIRKQCRLGIFTHFDLADDNGCLMGLFNLPTYAYATDQFEHKRTYFIIVFKVLLMLSGHLIRRYTEKLFSL